MKAPLHVETPVWESAPLAALLGAPVGLKMECFQPSASFKLRGHGAAAQAAVAAGARRLVASSGGNAGRAVAYAGRRLGVPVTVVVPRTTPESARVAIAAEGAELVEHGAVWDQAHEHALGLCDQGEAHYLHPFDDVALWGGHATLVEELARQGPRPAAIVLAVGGGGLLCGVLEGLRRVGWGELPVVAVETEGAASLRAALEAGEPVDLPAIDSVATSLGARRVARAAFEGAREHGVQSLVVSDREALGAALRFADEQRVLVEPACGAALAPLYGAHPALVGRGPVTVVVCGGGGVSLALFERWRARNSDPGH